MSAGLAFRKIVTAGTWCVDYNKSVNYWPSEGNVAEIFEVQRGGGGSACNFAIDLKRLDPDLDISTMGVYGDDENGQFLLNSAKELGIGTEGMIKIDNQPTAFTDAYTSKQNGTRTHIFSSGASAELKADHFDFAGLEGCFLHLGLPGAHRTLDQPNNGDATGWVTVLKKAKAAGMSTNVELMSIEDIGEIARLNRPSLPHLDMLIVNDIEIGALAGLPIEKDGETDIAACRQAATNVLDAGSMEFVCVHYPSGALCLTREGSYFEKTSVNVPPEAIKGANGAGDAFAAGFFYGVVHRRSIDDSLACAHAAAAASLGEFSTTGALTSMSKCLAQAEVWGWSN